MITATKYAKILANLDALAAEFQCRLGKTKKQARIADRSWGMALGLVGDYVGHRRGSNRVDDGDAFDEPAAADKSRLAQYRTSPPRPNNRTMPLAKAQALVHGIARTYCYISPTCEVVSAADELCRAYDLQLAPGKIVFSASGGGSISMSLLELITTTADPRAIAEYAKFGVVTPRFLATLFKDETNARAYWDDFRAALQAATGKWLALDGVTADVFKLAAVNGGSSDPNWRVVYRSKENLVGSVASWLARWQQLVNLSASVTPLSDQVESLLNLRDLYADDKRVDYGTFEMAVNNLAELYVEHLDAFNKPIRRDQPTFHEDSQVKKTLSVREVRKCSQKLAQIQRDRSVRYGVYRDKDWFKSPYDAALASVGERPYDRNGRLRKGTFATGSLPYFDSGIYPVETF